MQSLLLFKNLMKDCFKHFFIQIHGLLLLLVTLSFAIAPQVPKAEAAISSSKQCEYAVLKQVTQMEF